MPEPIIKITQKMRESIDQVDFENHLKDIHYDLYPGVLDDDLPDHFDNWVSSLELAELIKYAEEMCLIPARRIATQFLEKK